MSPRTMLTAIAKELSAELAQGAVGGSEQAAALMEGQPDLTIELPELIAAEIDKKRPNRALVEAFLFLLGHGLLVLRFQQEQSRPDAARILEQLDQKLVHLSQTGKMSAPLLLTILNVYADAQLPPSDTLRMLLEQLASAGAFGADEGELADSDAILVQEAGNDPFLLHDELAKSGQAFSDERRALMANANLQSDHEVMRDSGLGWLLDSGAVVRSAALDTLEHPAMGGRISPIMLRRLISIRNWVPASTRPQLDKLIQRCRLKGVECAPQSPPAIISISATGFDGAGAQSYFIQTKEGRKRAIASVLIKHDRGITDAWVHHNMSKSAAEDFLAGAANRVDLFQVGADHLTAVLAHFLAVGQGENGMLPPFALLDVVEVAGLAAINPSIQPLQMRIESLLAALPASWRRPDAADRAIRNSAAWGDEYDFTGFWFEQGPDAVQAMSAKKRTTDAGRIKILLETVMPAHRLKWADIIAWTALLLRQGRDRNWPAFALVAAAVAGQHPLADIPIMTRIAALSLEAWKYEG